MWYLKWNEIKFGLNWKKGQQKVPFPLGSFWCRDVADPRLLLQVSRLWITFCSL